MRFYLVLIGFFLGLIPLLGIYGQEIEILQKGPFSAWSPCTTTLRFQNTLDQPLFLLEYQIHLQENPSEVLYSFRSQRKSMACIEEGKAQISLTIELDEPGAAARMPYPPKVKEWGDIAMVEILRIAPKESVALTCSFESTEAWKKPLTVTATFVTTTLPCYKLSKIDNKTPPRPKHFSASSQTYTERWVITYLPWENAPSERPTTLDFPFVVPQWIMPELLFVESDFQTQTQTIQKSLNVQYEIKTPEFDRPQALASAKMTLNQALHSWSAQAELEGQLRYFRHGKVWWYVKKISELEAQEMGTTPFTTYLFGKGFQCALEGDYSHFLTTAHTKEAQETGRYLVYYHAVEEEPNSQVKAMIQYFQEVLHLKTQFGRLKGGGMEVFVEVPGTRLVSFLLDYASFQKK